MSAAPGRAWGLGLSLCLGLGALTTAACDKADEAKAPVKGARTTAQVNAGAPLKAHDEATSARATGHAPTDAGRTKAPANRAGAAGQGGAHAPAREPLPTAAPADLMAGFEGVPPGAHKTKSGVVWKTLRPGAGEATPKPDDRVTFHYVTWDPTGAVKGDSQRKGAPKEMRVRKMLRGWREVLGGMRVGERRRAWLPAKMARPRSRKHLSDLDRRVLDLELLAIAPAPAAPQDVKRPPKDAQRTASGLAYKVLHEGAKGGRVPQATSRVTVRYAGWTTDGRCFDFTGLGETTSFRVDGVIAGWTEGLQLMRVGDKVRFWIPEGLAYKGKPGKPKGMLVFDVELVATSTGR